MYSAGSAYDPEIIAATECGDRANGATKKPRPGARVISELSHVKDDRKEGEQMPNPERVKRVCTDAPISRCE